MKTFATHSAGLIIARAILALNERTEAFYASAPCLAAESPWVEGAKAICSEFSITPGEFVGMSREVLSAA